MSQSTAREATDRTAPEPADSSARNMPSSMQDNHPSRTVTESDIRWSLAPLGEFGRFEAVWQDLNRKFGNRPILDWRFIKPLADKFATPNERVAVARTGEEPVAICLVGPFGRLQWATFTADQAPLGFWLQSPDVPSPILFRCLARALPASCLILAAEKLDPLNLTRPAEESALKTLDFIETPAIPIFRAYDEIKANTSKSLLGNIKRKRAKLDRAGRTSHLEVVTEPDRIAEAVNDFGRIESAGWKGRIDSAIHPENEQGEVYRTIMTAFAELGEARAYRFWIDDELAASDLCLIRDRTLYSLKTTYDEKFRDISPTQLMRETVFEQELVPGGVERAEYYGRVKDWHRSHRAETRMMYHINLYRNTLIAKAHAASQRLREARAEKPAPKPKGAATS